MRDDGYNPIRWKCDGKGCFLKEAQPPSEWMCGAFGGKISFSDMDRIVERHGWALIWDQKRFVEELEPLNNTSHDAQAIMWRNLTVGGILTAVAVAGSVNPFEVEAYRLCSGGRWLDIVGATTTDFFDLCKRWFAWADAKPTRTGRVNKSDSLPPDNEPQSDSQNSEAESDQHQRMMAGLIACSDTERHLKLWRERRGQ